MNNPESLYQKLSETLLQGPTVTHIKEQKGEEHEQQQSNSLTTLEWKNINYILNHNNSTPELRNKVKNIIYNCYEDWAFSMVNIIKQKHWEKYGPIQLDELKLYGYIGLRKAVINYDSTKYNIFTNYAVKYIYSEVFSGIYELAPIYACDGNYRYIKKQKIIHRMNYKYKRNGTRRQKQILDNLDNENNNILRKKIAMEME
jgi:DNA-directed RNA polymerase specialized sigma subunit